MGWRNRFRNLLHINASFDTPKGFSNTYILHKYPKIILKCSPGRDMVSETVGKYPRWNLGVINVSRWMKSSKSGPGDQESEE